ncbi:hypothetical protein CZ787_09985 [Halomonas citrativorans]|uniref:Uncharacterized protein n=1 Tax=Halomonas citrativorans TaxID=2742612 RepID=A0A1R4I0T5_9GAMM|nr:hypothetical protein CZ787_09985 [Halomonas citrativorans]
MTAARFTPSRNEEFMQPSFYLASGFNIVPAVAPSIAGITLMAR